MFGHNDMTRAEREAIKRRAQWIPTRIEIVLWFAGVLAGLGAAFFSFAYVPSWWLAFFVYVIVSHSLGRGLPEVIAKPYRLARSTYYALFPVLAIAILYVIYNLWGTMWVAAVLGLVCGGLIQITLGSMLLPDYTPTEGKDEKQEMWLTDPHRMHQDTLGPQDTATREADRPQTESQLRGNPADHGNVGK